MGLSPDHVARERERGPTGTGVGAGGSPHQRSRMWPAADLEATLLELIAPEGAEDAFSRKGIFWRIGYLLSYWIWEQSDRGQSHPLFIRATPCRTRLSISLPKRFYPASLSLLLHDGQDLVLDGHGSAGFRSLKTSKFLLRSVPETKTK